MRFELIDRILEHAPGRLVGVKSISLAEEYLQDHFAGFPILPGVFMLEAMTQAARRLAAADGDGPRRLVLGRVRALKYGAVARPGDTLRVTVERQADPLDFKARCELHRFDAPPGSASPIAAAGRITLRPLTGGG